MADKKDFNEYTINDNIVTIYLSDRLGNRKETYIDLEDLQRIKNLDLHWHYAYHKSVGEYYVCATQHLGLIDGKRKSKNILLHQMILSSIGNGRKFGIDHIDHNTFNNCKNNLRIITNSNNSRNRNGANTNNKSGYRNVSWNKSLKKWVIQLQVNGKNHIFEEKFDNVEDAGKFAEEMRIKYYGEYAGKG